MGKANQKRLSNIRKNDRLEATAKSAESSRSEILEKLVGCPLPDVINASNWKSCPHKEPATDDDGVKMICSSETCSLSNLPLHTECFNYLQAELVKNLASQGSARGWTESQRLNNLWEKKGQSLISKFIRCQCGHGLMTLDKDAKYEKEKQEKLERRMNKKKKDKKNQLPALHFITVPDGRAALDEQRKSSSENSKSKKRGRQFSECSAISAITVNTILVEEHAAVTTRSRSRQDVMSISESDVFEEEIVPAPLPPAQIRSYASAIKISGVVQVQHDDTGYTTMIPYEESLIEQDETKSEENQSNSTNSDKGMHAWNLEILSPISMKNENEINHLEEKDDVMDVWKEETDKNNWPQLGRLTTTKSPVTSTPINRVPPRLQKIERRGKALSFADAFQSETMIETGKKIAVVEAVEKNVGKEQKSPSPKEPIGRLIYGWTPFNGMDFNLGEQFMYLP